MVDEGASEKPGGTASKFKRSTTLVAGQHLNSVSSKQMSAADNRNKRVNDLAKKLLILYNVSSVSFYGHMQTCALKDLKVENEELLGLGRLSAIDKTN